MSDIPLAGIRDAVLGVSALAPAMRAEQEVAARGIQEQGRRLQVEAQAQARNDKLLAGPDAFQATLPLIVAERARPPVLNALRNEPDLRGRRRKMRLPPRSRWTELAQQLGRHLDVFV